MKKTKTQKGITLVALIITIIVLLILAVVAITAIQNDGIFGHANNAATKFNDAQGNEQNDLNTYEDLLNRYAGGSSTVVTPGEGDGDTSETPTIKIGDKVNYIEGTSAPKDMEWIVLNVNSSGQVTLISTQSTDYVTGITWDNLMSLDTQCNTWYGTDVGTARNLKVEDIFTLCNYTPSTTGEKWWRFKTNVTSPTEVTVNKVKSSYSTDYNQEDGTGTWSEWEEADISWDPPLEFCGGELVETDSEKYYLVKDNSSSNTINFSNLTWPEGTTDWKNIITAETEEIDWNENFYESDGSRTHACVALTNQVIDVEYNYYYEGKIPYIYPNGIELINNVKYAIDGPPSVDTLNLFARPVVTLNAGTTLTWNATAEQWEIGSTTAE